MPTTYVVHASLHGVVDKHAKNQIQSVSAYCRMALASVFLRRSRRHCCRSLHFKAPAGPYFAHEDHSSFWNKWDLKEGPGQALGFIWCARIRSSFTSGSSCFTFLASASCTVGVTHFPRGGSKWEVSAAGGSSPRWRRNCKELFSCKALSSSAGLSRRANSP